MPTITDRKLKPKSDLGRRLLLLCEAKGHRSLADAARASGLNYFQLYQIIRAATDPKWSTLSRIVVALGGTMEELFAVAPGSHDSRVDRFEPACIES